MRFTLEQWEEIKPMYFDDLPLLGDEDQDYMLEVFNNLPRELQGLAVQHGANDTEVREKIFEFLCYTQFGVTTKEFYDKKLYDHPKTNFKFSVYVRK